MVDNIVITLMLESDIDEVIELGLATKELQVSEDKSMYYGEEVLSSAIKSENEICLVAKVNGKFAGFKIVHFNPVFKEVYFSDIAIKPEFRGMGIGQKLYQKTFELIKELKPDWIWALVHEDNDKMVNFMEKQGFTKGRKFYFFYKPQV